MKSTRRHDSLILLSREHHYALMLCLRIHRGMVKHREDASWLQKKAADAIRFFEGDLIDHFGAEEEALFPAMRDLADATALIQELLSEHREMERLIECLRRARDESLATLLNQFADLLEAHIRKEERQLFPVYERQVSSTLARQVGQRVSERIGPAAQPKHPELLR
jgi:hemerythrin-like domain-containing protein